MKWLPSGDTTEAAVEESRPLGSLSNITSKDIVICYRGICSLKLVLGQSFTAIKTGAPVAIDETQVPGEARRATEKAHAERGSLLRSQHH